MPFICVMCCLLSLKIHKNPSKIFVIKCKIGGFCWKYLIGISTSKKHILLARYECNKWLKFCIILQRQEMRTFLAFFPMRNFVFVLLLMTRTIETSSLGSPSVFTVRTVPLIMVDSGVYAYDEKCGWRTPRSQNKHGRSKSQLRSWIMASSQTDRRKNKVREKWGGISLWRMEEVERAVAGPIPWISGGRLERLQFARIGKPASHLDMWAAHWGPLLLRFGAECWLWVSSE